MSSASDPIQLRRDEHGRLTIRQDDRDIPVTARPCFPLSHPEELISFRDKDHNEIALLHRPADLSPESAEALAKVLEEASFMFEITRIDAIEKEFELRSWRVQTNQGVRQFQTRLDDWPRPLESGASVVHDVSGDQYLIPPIQQFDPKSKQLLWPLLDSTDKS